MMERLAYEDTDKRIYVTDGVDDAPQTVRYEWAEGQEPAEQRIAELEAEVRGMRDRVAAVEQENNSRKS